MIYQYEIACKEAGMNEEAIAEIRRMFDADYKKLKRLNQRLEDEEDELTILHVSEFEDDDSDVEGFELEDPNADVENNTIQAILLNELDGYLNMLTVEDQQFILKYFSFKSKPVNQTAAFYGYSSAKVIWTRDRILKALRKNFGV